jgi:serine/threonine protein kinase
MLQTQDTYSPALPSGYALQEYTIEAVLGIGGFGITYRAHDNHLHHKVAIKEFFPASLAARNPATGTVGIKSPDCQSEFTWGKTRYTQEAQTLARFNHPNIVRVHRYFEANSTSYLVMVFEEGQSLETLLNNSQEEWTQARVLELLMPLLSGLAEIHGGGYLHRDIKPENIILRSKDNTPVLLDFGAARSITASHTMTALVSPGYGPAEQYSTDHTDQGPWTDIYAMAAVAYRIVSGRVPVPAPNRLKKDSLIPAVFVGDGRYSKPFLSAIDLALSINDKQRPQSVTAWIEALTATPTIAQAEPSPATPQPEPEPEQAAPRNAPTPDPQPIRIQSPPPNPTSQDIHPINRLARPLKAMPQRETFLQRHNINLRHLWLATFVLLIALVVGSIGLLTTDTGYLRTAHFIYTTALKADNPDLTYAFICPSYFHSEMNRSDLDIDRNTTQWADNISITAKDKAAITTIADIGTGLVKTQTWTKPTVGSFWCRDVLHDFNNNKTQLPTPTSQPKRTTTASSKKR